MIDENQNEEEIKTPEPKENNANLMGRDKINEALDQGYTHEQIFEFFSKKPELQEKLKASQEAGYNPEQIINYFKDKPTEQEKEIAQSFDFYGKKPSPETIRDLRRQAGIQLKAVAKGTGTWGNLAQIPGNLLAKAVSSMGGDGQVYKEIFNQLNPLSKLPTSEEMGDLFTMASKEKFEPKTRGEKYAANITENVIGNMSIGIPPSAAARGAVLGQSLRFTGEQLGAPDWVNTGLEMTGNVAGSAKYTGINAYKTALYDNVTKNLPKNAEVAVGELTKDLKVLKSGLVSTGLQKTAAAAKGKVVQVIDEVMGKVKNGKINIKDAWDTRKDIYKLLGANYAEVAGYKAQLKSVNKFLNNTLKNTRTEFPEFYKNLQKADNFFGDAAKFEKSIKFIESVKDAEKFSVGIAMLKGTWKQIPKMIGIGSALNFAQDLLRTPSMMKYYFNGIKAAAVQNKFGVTQAAKQLDIGAAKELEKRKKEAAK